MGKTYELIEEDVVEYYTLYTGEENEHGDDICYKVTVSKAYGLEVTSLDDDKVEDEEVLQVVRQYLDIYMSAKERKFF